MFGTLASQPLSRRKCDRKRASSHKQTHILFIMADDIGLMQGGHLHRGWALGETPNTDRIGREGGMFTQYCAMQSCTSGRSAFITRMYPLQTRVIPPQFPGSPTYLLREPPTWRYFLRSGLHDGPVWQESSGPPHRLTADGTWFSGVLGILVSPRCHAASQLSRHQPQHNGTDSRTAL